MTEYSEKPETLSREQVRNALEVLGVDALDEVTYDALRGRRNVLVKQAHSDTTGDKDDPEAVSNAMNAFDIIRSSWKIDDGQLIKGIVSNIKAEANARNNDSSRAVKAQRESEDRARRAEAEAQARALKAQKAAEERAKRYIR